MSMETDAQSYIGRPPVAALPPRQLPQVCGCAASRVYAYRRALEAEVTNGLLTERRIRQIASDPRMLGAASVSWWAMALGVFTRKLHLTRREPLGWGNNRYQVEFLEGLANEAAEKVQLDLLSLGY